MRHLFRRMSIRSQLTTVILALVMLPLLVMFLSNRTFIQSRLYSQTSDTYASALTQASSHIADKVELTKNLVSMLFADSDVQQGIAFRSSDSDESHTWVADLSSNRVIYKGSLLGSASKVYFYSNEASLDFRSDNLYTSLSPEAQEQFETWYAGDGQNYCFITFTQEQLGFKPRYIYMIAKVPSATRLGKYLGVIETDIPIAPFEEILASVSASSHSALYLISSDGEPFIRSGNAILSGNELNALCALLDQNPSQDSALSQVIYQGETYLAAHLYIPGTQWRIVMTVPQSDLSVITHDADQILLFTMLLILLLIIPATALISRSILKPIYNLQEGVNAISQGDYNITVPLCGTLELDQVIDSFNFMCQQTQVMMDEQYRMGQDLKSKELRVLQEQINPHFLYNTIDLLHWQARKVGSKEMEDIVYSLSQFYKLSLGHGEKIVTLGHELRLVSAYMRIQNIRFMNRIRLDINVPEELENVRIVKMVLQPLVENSIQHGIREKPDETGTISIYAERQGDDVLLTVADDGVGMDDETITRITTSEHPGYGVYNVNDRLILHYGSNAGLVFHSTPGKGTVVTLRIPFE